MYKGFLALYELVGEIVDGYGAVPVLVLEFLHVLHERIQRDALLHALVCAEVDGLSEPVAQPGGEHQERLVELVDFFRRCPCFVRKPFHELLL